MAKRKLNKSLVAGLTFVGMFLSVAVVALAAMRIAQKDPTVFAAKAAEREQAGDRIRAADYYQRAYRINHDPNYVVAAARNVFELGDIALSLRILSEAHALTPNESAISEECLKQLWRLKGVFADLYGQVRERSNELLAADPANVLGLVSRAEALTVLANQDPNYPKLAEAAMKTATDLAPDDPRVALTRARLMMLKARATAKASADDPDAVSGAEVGNAAVEILRAAAAKNPGDEDLATQLGRSLMALNRLPEALAVMEQAAAANPSSAEIQSVLATALLISAQREVRGADGNREKGLAIAARALEAAQRATELDPAEYQGYATAAEAQLLAIDGKDAAADAKVYERVLGDLDAALQKTVGVETLRAKLGEALGERPQLMTRGFETALAYRRVAPDDAGKEAGLKLARKFVGAAATQFPSYYLTSMMEGELAVQENDPRAAVRHYKRADELTTGQRGLAYINLLARERLALLYREISEPGLSAQMSESAIAGYESLGRVPPAMLWKNRIDLLIRFGEYQKALTAIDTIADRYPDEKRPLTGLRAAALTGLGRDVEGAKLLEEVASGENSGLLYRAHLATVGGDLDRADRLLRDLLTAEPRNMAAMNLLTSVAIRADKRKEAAEFVQGLLARETDEGVRRVLTANEIALTATDPNERDARLRQVIEGVSDPLQKAGEWYTFYVTRDDLEQAQKYLDEIEKLRPDERNVWEQQFNLALRRKALERAEAYAVKLAKADADRAGGATYRAAIKVASDDLEGALSEFENARRQLPEDSRLKIRTAQVLLNTKPPRVEEALPLLQEAVQSDPLDFQGNKLLFAVLEQLGRRQEGFQYLKAAARINPSDPFVRDRKQFMDEQVDPRAGAAAREKQREKDPNDIENLVRLGELYMLQSQDPKQTPEGQAAVLKAAGERFAAAIALDPTHLALGSSVLAYYATTGQREQGEAFLNQRLEATKGTARLDARLHRAKFLEALGDRSAAQAEYVALEKEAAAAEGDAAEKLRVYSAAATQLVEFYNRTNQVQLEAEAAQRLIDKLPAGDERQPRLRLMVVDAMMRSEQYGKAKEALDKLRADFPKDLRSQVTQAQLLISTPQSDPDKRKAALLEAREIMTRVIKDAPEQPLAWFIRGAVALELARYHGQKSLLSEARQDLLKSKQLGPNSLALRHRFTLVDLYEMNNEAAPAEAELTELVELQPDNGAFLARLLQHYRNTDQLKKAQAYMEKRAQAQPNNPLFWHQLARLLIEQGEDSAALRPLQQALAAYQKAQMPATACVLDLLTTLVKAHREKDAVAMFEKLDAAALFPVIRGAGGQAYAAAGQKPKALQQFEEGLTAAVKTSPGELNQVLTSIRAGLTRPEAIELIKRVLGQTAEEPGAVQLRILLAAFLIDSREEPGVRDGLALLEDAAKRVQAGSPLQMSILLNRARALDALRDHEATAKVYEQALALNPSDVQALNNLAYKLTTELKRPAEALPYAERLSDVAQRMISSGTMDRDLQVTVLDTIGWVFCQNNRLDAAEATLSEAVRTSPKDVPSRYHLGEVYRKQGRTGDARRELEKARDASKQSADKTYLPEIEKALSELK